MAEGCYGIACEALKRPYRRDENHRYVSHEQSITVVVVPLFRAKTRQFTVRGIYKPTLREKLIGRKNKRGTQDA